MLATDIQRYSQREEQSAILSAVGSEVGTFLDIGAWNARDMSNTRALFELGWSGVMVEFSPKPLEGLIREYGNEPRIKIIAAAVGLERALAKFNISEDAVSTSNEGNYERWKEHGGFYGLAYVPTIRLEDIYDKFGIFDFVSIDVEGSSADLFFELLSFLPDYGRLPHCICVEHDGRQAECEEAATWHGYRKVYESEENLVFAR